MWYQEIINCHNILYNLQQWSILNSEELGNATLLAVKTAIASDTESAEKVYLQTNLRENLLSLFLLLVSPWATSDESDLLLCWAEREFASISKRSMWNLGGLRQGSFSDQFLCGPPVVPPFGNAPSALLWPPWGLPPSYSSLHSPGGSGRSGPPPCTRRPYTAGRSHRSWWESRRHWPWTGLCSSGGSGGWHKHCLWCTWWKEKPQAKRINLKCGVDLFCLK